MHEVLTPKHLTHTTNMTKLPKNQHKHRKILPSKRRKVRREQKFFLQQQKFALLHKELLHRVNSYYTTIDALELSSLWRRSWEQYHSGFYQLGLAQLVASGASGGRDELLKLSVNDYGNIIRNLHTLITREPPLIDAKPINASAGALREVIPAKVLLEFYQDQKYLDRAIAEAKLYELLFGAGYLVVDWDKHAEAVAAGAAQPKAKPHKTPNVRLRGQGELYFTTHTPFDVIQNVYGRVDELSWYIIRTLKSRRALSKHYGCPVLAEEPIYNEAYIDFSLNSRSSKVRQHDSDKLDVYTYYEAPSTSFPQGRKVVFTGNYVLEQGVLAARRLPVVRLANETMLNTTLGVSIAFDLLTIQKAKDNLVSTILNNQASFGLNSIVVPKSAQIEANQLGSRLNILEVSDMSERPEVLDLLRSHPELFQMVTYLERAMERISGVNAVVRGSARASQSGQALALITSMSLQFASGYLRTFREAYKAVGEQVLALLKYNLSAERQYRIVGRTGRIFTGALSGEQLERSYQVSVELVSPLKATAQGREIIASTLLERGLISEPREYLSVLLHGRIDDILTPAARLKESLKREAETLLSGQSPKVLALQNHPAFIRHNLNLLNDHEQLKDSEWVGRVYETVLERLATWKRVSVEHGDLLQLAGIPLYSAEALRVARIDALAEEQARADAAAPSHGPQPPPPHNSADFADLAELGSAPSTAADTARAQTPPTHDHPPPATSKPPRTLVGKWPQTPITMRAAYNVRLPEETPHNEG